MYVFEFDWNSIVRVSENNDVNKAVIRAHLRSLPGRVPDSGPVVVQVVANVSVGILDDDDTPATTSEEARFSLLANSSRWIQIDITAGIKAVWDRSNASVVVVSIQLSAEEDGMVPAEIVDPLAMPLDEHRNRCTALQPLLLLYLEDGSLKTRAKVLSTGPAAEGGALQDTVTARARRTPLRGSSCSLYNYTVTFSDIGVDYVLAPETVNVGGCSGSCATSYQRSMPPGTVTNHASVIAAADGLQKESSQGCCSPLRYQPIYLMVVNSEAILRVQLFTDMVVSTCGCS